MCWYLSTTAKALLSAPTCRPLPAPLLTTHISVSSHGQNHCTSRMSLLPEGFLTAACTAAKKARSRNSSVGRALDWRSKGPWFDPGFRHLILLTIMIWNYERKIGVEETSQFSVYFLTITIVIINYHVPIVSSFVKRNTKKETVESVVCLTWPYNFISWHSSKTGYAAIAWH